MAARFSRFAGRSPRALLAAMALLAVAVGAYATGVPEELAIGGGSSSGSQSESASASLAAETGYDPEPAYLVLLTAGEPAPADLTALVVETVAGQIESINGVAAVLEGAGAVEAQTSLLAVHLRPDADAESVAGVGEALSSSLDAGPLETMIAGTVPTQAGARGAGLDEAPKLLLLVAPLLLLILIGALGLRPAIAALIGALFAAVASIAAIGALDSLIAVQAVAAIVAGFLAAVLAVQSGAGLLFRYREEAATLGPGPEALEYTAHTLLKGSAIGMLSTALVGVAMFAIPIEFVRSIGTAVLIAAAFGPVLGLLSMAAALSLSPAARIGEALPLVSDDARVDNAPRAFRAMFALGRGRGRAIVVALPLLIVAALALPVRGSEAIGLDAAELPADESAAQAQAVLAGAFGPGAAGPLFVLTDGPGEAPTVTIYRDAIARLGTVATVGRAVTAGPYAAFAATPDSRAQSLAAQRTVAEVRAVPAPSPRSVGGPAAELSDSAGRIGRDLPLVGLVALLGSAALWSLLFRSAFGPLLALSALIAPLAGTAAMIAIFSHGRLTGLLDYQASGAPHLQSYVIVGSILLVLALVRGAEFATALREERSLGGGAAGSLARSGQLTLAPLAVATLFAIALAGVWLGSDLLPAKEIAVGLCAGLLADLLIARTLLAPALARASM